MPPGPGKPLPAPNHSLENKCAIEKINLRPGFDFLIFDYPVDSDYTHESCEQVPKLGIGFCLSGHMEGRLTELGQHMLTEGGQSQLFAFPNQIGSVKDRKGSYRRSIGVLIEPQVMYTLLDGNLKGLPRALSAFIEGNTCKYYGFQGRTPPSMSLLFEQLVSCPWTGTTKRLFFESKAFEIIATLLRQVECDPKPLPKGFSRAETNRLYEAAEWLRDGLEDPPSLFQLARNAGMSHVKLNRGFRCLFDTTVFGYLRRVRLERARHLLEKSETDVTSAALSVGYTSVSAFSRAFLATYGYKPSLVKKTCSMA